MIDKTESSGFVIPVAMSSIGHMLPMLGKATTPVDGPRDRFLSPKPRGYKFSFSSFDTCVAGRRRSSVSHHYKLFLETLTWTGSERQASVIQPRSVIITDAITLTLAQFLLS